MFGTVIWALNYSVAKYAIGGLEPLVFNALRYIVAAGTMGVGLWLLKSPWTRVAPADRLSLIRVGLVANVLCQIAFVTGLSMTSAGNAAVLFATAPLWTLVINAKRTHEPIGFRMWEGILLSLVGVAMIIGGSSGKMTLGGPGMVGDVTCLGSAVLWGLSTNLQKPLLGRYSPMQLTLIMMAVGAAGLAIAALPSAATMDWAGPGWGHFAGAIGSGVFSLAVGNVFWSRGIQQLGPARTGAFGNLVPVIALCLSALLLSEQIGPLQLAGAAVTIAGVWLARS
jgi:drug/metabolite transporter (DMT)-like permease